VASLKFLLLLCGRYALKRCRCNCYAKENIAGRSRLGDVDVMSGLWLKARVNQIGHTNGIGL
jgi:hypothetical protein